MEKMFEIKEIKDILIRLEEGMINYLEYEDENLEDEIPYDRNDIKTCMDFLKNFLENTWNKENFLENIKNLKEDLQNLNEKCENELLDANDENDIFEIILEVNKLNSFGFSKEELENILK